jgi:uncharacterized RDD family membrane protein YckC
VQTGEDIRTYPGRRLGRPEQGPGSVARPGRRLAAVAVDWAIALAISARFFGADSWSTLLVFGVMQVVLVGSLGSSIGHRLLGLQVVTLDGAWAGPLRALVRSALLCLAVPALIWNADQRGLHDQAAGTVLVRRP